MTTIELEPTTKPPQPPVFETGGDLRGLETIVRVSQIQAEVRTELWYDVDDKSSIDDLYETGLTSCIGYAIRGSEKLEAAGIPHSIGFVNGHATILVETEEDLWLFDMLGPELNQPIDQSMKFYDETSDRKIFRLNTASLLEQTKFDTDSGTDAYPWLGSRGPERRIGRFTRHNDLPQNFELLMAVYEPELGRSIAYNYAKFHEEYAAERIESAANYMISMNGIFPDVDTRRHEHVKRVVSIVRRLAAAKQFDLASNASNAYFTSLEKTTDSIVTEGRADCLRYIATHSGESGLAQKALELYSQAERRSRPSRSIPAKKKLCKNIIPVSNNIPRNVTASEGLA